MNVESTMCFSENEDTLVDVIIILNTRFL
jgi:hypothetical protein